MPGIAATLQAALDDWARKQARAAKRSRASSRPVARARAPFDPAEALAPLPRAYHWVDGSAYVNHVELVRKARGARCRNRSGPIRSIYQGGSDDFLPPRRDAPFANEDWGIDLEGEVAVVTDDVPMGTDAAAAREHIQLVMLVNDWSLRNLIPGELAKGFGFYQSKPATAFSPVAVTPDELGAAWRDAQAAPAAGRAPQRPAVRPAGRRRRHDLRLRAADRARREDAAARRGQHRRLRHGVESRPQHGSTCLAERRMLETLDHGKPMTPFLSFGDRVRIEMLDAAGHSIFGAIDQRVARAA